MVQCTMLTTRLGHAFVNASRFEYVSDSTCSMTAVEEYGLAQPIFRGVSYAVGHWVLVNLIIWRLVPQHSLMTQKTVQST
jgi:hypothetical protein